MMNAIEVLDDLHRIGDELRAKSRTPDSTAIDDALLELVRDVDFSQLIPGPLGIVLETIDDPLAQLRLVGRIRGLLRKVHPFRRQRRANQPDEPAETEPTDETPTEITPSGN